MPQAPTYSDHMAGHNYTVSSDGAAAVDPDYFWLDIDENTPRGVKLQLLTEHGIALHGKYNLGDTDIVGWTPLPKRRPK